MMHVCQMCNGFKVVWRYYDEGGSHSPVPCPMCGDKEKEMNEAAATEYLMGGVVHLPCGDIGEYQRDAIAATLTAKEKKIDSATLTDSAIKWIDVKERSRLYIFPDGQRVQFGNVSRIEIRASGKHRLQFEGGFAFVNSGWLYVIIDTDEMVC